MKDILDILYQFNGQFENVNKGNFPIKKPRLTFLSQMYYLVAITEHELSLMNSFNLGKCIHLRDTKNFKSNSEEAAGYPIFRAHLGSGGLYFKFSRAENVTFIINRLQMRH